MMTHCNSHNRIHYKLLIGLSILVLFVLARPAFAATVSLSPGTGVYTAGNTFSASVIVNTAGDAINAAEGNLSFDPSKLSVVNISRGSMFNLWTVEPSFSNSAGTITFGGGSPGGYTGSAGTVMTITFRAKTAGTARVNWSDASVLAADGRGTNVLTSMGGGNYTIASAEVAPEPEVIEYVAPANTPAAPQVRSSTHPDPQGWYPTDTASLSWSVPAGVTGVRTLLDGNSGSIPTKVYEPPIGEITIEDLDEGVSYFHLQFRNSEGWGRVTHYRLGVDTEKPTDFSISLAEDADLSDPEQNLLLDVTDATSPVRRFEVQIDDGDPFEYIDESGSSTITLPALEPGKHSVIIEAFDAAGNSIVDTFSFTITAFDRPIFTEYPEELTAGVIPVIKGQTKPRAEVTITMSRGDFEPVTDIVTANDDGEFTFIPSNPLENGVYTLSAVAVDENGAKSQPSETISIAVQPPGYIQIGSMLVSALSVFVPLIALVVLLVVFIWYVIYRLRRLRSRVALESDEAADMLEAEFSKLRDLLAAEEEALAASRKSKKLTKAETHLIETMREEFKHSSERVRKEISDVAELVDDKK